jgi:hypothetical protein
MPPPELHAQRLRTAEQQVADDRKAANDKWKECRDNGLFQSSVQDTIAMKSSMKDRLEQNRQGISTQEADNLISSENASHDIEAMVKVAFVQALNGSKMITDASPGEHKFEGVASIYDTIEPLAPVARSTATTSHVIELAEKMDALRLSLMHLIQVKREGANL